MDIYNLTQVGCGQSWTKLICTFAQIGDGRVEEVRNISSYDGVHGADGGRARVPRVSPVSRFCTISGLSVLAFSVKILSEMDCISR